MSSSEHCKTMYDNESEMMLHTNCSIRTVEGVVNDSKLSLKCTNEMKKVLDLG